MNKFLMLLMILPSIAFAEPGPLTRQLMQEPASLFDVSMLRLKYSIGYREKQIIANYNRSSRSKATSQSNRRNSSGNVNVAYDSKADKIYIYLSITDGLSTQAQMKAGCKSGLRDIAIIVRKSSPSFFEHQGVEISSISPERYMSILDLFEFRCYVHDRDSSKGRFWATQTTGTQMEVGRWPPRD